MAFAALTLAFTLTGPPPGGAADWIAPVGCPSHAQVASLAGELLLNAPERELEFSGEIRVADVGYRMEVVVAGTRREVVSDSCAMLGQAAALIVAVAYDPVAVVSIIDAPVQRPAESELEPTPPLEPQPEPDPDPKRRGNPPAAADEYPAPVRRRPAPLGGLVRASFGAGGGILPSAGIGFELAGALRGEHWRAGLGATGWLPRTVDSPDNEEFGARTALFAAQARGCYVVTLPNVEFPFCGGIEAGGLWAEGFGPAGELEAEVQAWVGLFVSGGVAWWVRPRLGLAARLELPIGIYSPAVHINGVGRLFRAGPLGTRGFVGPTLRFP